MTRPARLPLLLLLLPLLAAGCATARQEQDEAQARRQALLRRLPATIGGFTLQPPPPDAVTARSARQIYRQGEDGILVGVMLTGLDAPAPEVDAGQLALPL